jgi:DNA-binding Lrp family transcriptional regulator
MATVARNVDELDRELVSRLRVDGRESNRSLAAALGVNETTVAARLRRLERDRVVRVVAVTDMAAFGNHTMGFAFIRVGERTAREVAADVAMLPAATGVIVCSGRIGVIATLLAHDPGELAGVVADGIAAIPGVAGVQVELAVDIALYDSHWAGMQFDASLPTPPLGGEHSELDIALVEVLQRDARSSNRSIAAQLGVSEATVRSRLRRLEEQDAIRIQAVCDVDSFGLTANGFLAVDAAPGRMRDVQALLVAESTIGFAARTLGSADFVAIIAADSREHMLEVVMTRLAGDDAIAGIQLYESFGVVKHVYTWTRLLNS